MYSIVYVLYSIPKSCGDSFCIVIMEYKKKKLFFALYTSIIIPLWLENKSSKMKL